jgi:hypothetical protein
MRLPIDKTHNPALRSWVVSANGHRAFPIQNLPIGVFSIDSEAPRGGIAIGDSILDLRALLNANILTGNSKATGELCALPTLNEFLALNAESRIHFRNALYELLATDAPPHPEFLRDATVCVMHMPARIGDYTDFYTGINHALNVGRLFRPDAPPASKLQMGSYRISRAFFIGSIIWRAGCASERSTHYPARRLQALDHLSGSITSWSWDCGSGMETNWAIQFQLTGPRTVSRATVY